MEQRGINLCHECISLLRGSTRLQFGLLRQNRLIPVLRRSFITQGTTKVNAHDRRSGGRYYGQSQHFKGSRNPLQRQANIHHTSTPDLNVLHNRILELSASVLKAEDQIVPSEQRVLYVLEQLDMIAKTLDADSPPGLTVTRRGQPSTATSALLGSVNARQYPAFLSKAGLLDLVSQKAEELMRHPHIFITPAILRSYVGLQIMLHRPSSFPDIFELYSKKPIPKASGSAVEYTPASPDKVNAAIDVNTANMALQAAMHEHNLPLCIDIITSTFATSAFKKNKVLRQALAPAALATAAPLVAYALSAQFGMLQNSMDPAYATSVAFAGIITYVGTVCSLGYIVVTTANDQMDRVTWAKGVPLWERWVREDERAALDRVAGKWGFQSLERRGEEEGEEWESLREFVGLSGMVLDKVELMEGME